MDKKLGKQREYHTVSRCSRAQAGFGGMGGDEGNMSQVKCKTRVAAHGEVFTHEREVNAMLDLVKNETERIDSRFLEPACGTGNFLAEILRRKLEIVKNRYKKSQLEYERYAIVAISSIYGIDILEDNVSECRHRLYDIFESQYSELFKSKTKEACKQSAAYILSKNILWGDALTLNRADEKEKHIIFPEWSFVSGSMVKRRDFVFEALIQSAQKSIFDENILSDEGKEVFIPTPIKEYPLTHFLKVADV